MEFCSYTKWKLTLLLSTLLFWHANFPQLFCASLLGHSWIIHHNSPLMRVSVMMRTSGPVSLFLKKTLRLNSNFILGCRFFTVHVVIWPGIRTSSGSWTTCLVCPFSRYVFIPLYRSCERDEHKILTQLVPKHKNKTSVPQNNHTHTHTHTHTLTHTHTHTHILSPCRNHFKHFVKRNSEYCADFFA